MGVHSLWDLLLPTARRIMLEELRGQTLAIDASIWMVKVQSIYRMVDQMIMSIFNKIMMLLRAGIRPIFVFDGQTLDLKRNTVEKRRRNMLQTADNEIRRKAQLEIIKLMKEGGKPVRKSQEAVIKKVEEPENEPLSEIELMKLEMYSERLNEEYSGLVQAYPYLQPQYSVDTFYKLTIIQRQQIIKSLKSRAHFHRNEEMKRKAMERDNEKSYRQRFMEDLKKIKRSATLTKIRNEHYHELMKKVEETTIKEGVEIAKGEYQGQLFEMERKQEGSTKKNRRYHQQPMKNNLKEILARRHQEQKEELEREKVLKEVKEMEEKQKLSEVKEVVEQETATKQQIKCDPVVEHVDNQDQIVYEEEETKMDEQYSQITLCMDVEKLKRIAGLVTKTQQIKENTQPKEEVKEKKIAPQDELPTHIMDYSAPMPQVFIDNLEVKQLLDFLGLPFINAPYEAEAQCAQLEAAGLVDGIVTEDSDVFLFGGRNVYRGVFQNDVKFYSIERIRKDIGMNRMKCIIFALFLGSDYTEGVKGIGIVNATEILTVFDSIQKIKRLKEWAIVPDQLVQFHSYKGCTSQEIQFFQFHKNFKKYWYLDDDFPNMSVINEYLDPHVDKVSQRLKWKQPDLSKIQTVLLSKFKMRQQQIDPVIQAIEKAYKDYVANKQTKINEYFTRVEKEAPCGVIKSRRLKKALGKDDQTNNTEE